MSQKAYLATDFTFSYTNLLSGGHFKELAATAPDGIDTAFQSIYFAKQSSLAAPINWHIANLHSNGMFTRWRIEYSDPYLYSRIRKMPQILTMDQAEGIFYVCGSLHALAVLIFALELLSLRLAIVARIFSRI